MSFPYDARALVVAYALVMAAGCSHTLRPATGPFMPEYSVVLSDRAPSNSATHFLTITLSDPSKGKELHSCEMTGMHIRPIDDDLVVFVHQDNETPKAILALNYNDPKNRPGEVFEFKYSDVPYTTPFIVDIHVRNTLGVASNAFLEIENLEGRREIRRCGAGNCSHICRLAAFVANPPAKQ